MSKTMAEVLNEHHDWAFRLEQGEVLCVGCDWSQKVGVMDPAAEVFRAHQSDALSAAGFGLVTDAKAEALEEAADHAEAFGLETVNPRSLRNRAANLRNPS